jgi:HK97 family phage major capsid protein
MATATSATKEKETKQTPVGVEQVVQEIKLLRDELKAAQEPVTKAGAILASAEKLAATAKDHVADRKWGWQDFGEQLKCIHQYAINKHAQPDKRLYPDAAQVKAATGLGESIGSDGGFLIAPAFAEGILEIMHQQENLLDLTDQYSLASNSIKVRAVDETSRATGSRRGGIRAFWLDEGEEVTGSKPKFKLLELRPYKLGVYVNITDELLEDGGGMLEQYVAKAAAEEINFFIGDAIINGTGAGQPLGILNSSARVTVAKESGQPAATIVAENIAEMFKRMHAASRANAIWLINQDTERQLHLMNVAIGTSGQLVYMPPGGLSNPQYATLYGKRVMPIEFCPTLGTEGDIILWDPKSYISVTRGAIKPAMSMHVEFKTDQMAYRFIFRVDGKPWWTSTLTPFKGTQTQSPIITLATRA